MDSVPGPVKRKWRTKGTRAVARLRLGVSPSASRNPDSDEASGMLFIEQAADTEGPRG